MPVVFITIELRSRQKRILASVASLDRDDDDDLILLLVERTHGDHL